MPRKSKSQIAAEAAAEFAAQSRLVGRRAEEFAHHVMGWTHQDIADKFGLARSTVTEDIGLHRATMTPAQREHVQAEHLTELAMLRKSMFELATKVGAPVTAGKDGDIVKDPESGEVVRDFTLRINATVQLLKIMEREAKQLGTDAAAKVEHSGVIAIEGTVEQELARLSAELGLSDRAEMPLPATSESVDGR
jgi:nucleotide-binding universal stress UspA family protein